MLTSLEGSQSRLFRRAALPPAGSPISIAMLHCYIEGHKLVLTEIVDGRVGSDSPTPSIVVKWVISPCVGSWDPKGNAQDDVVALTTYPVTIP